MVIIVIQSGIIGVLGLVIFILIRKLELEKKAHQTRLTELYSQLEKLDLDKENNRKKLTLQYELQTTILESRKHLNQTIFDLQRLIFTKIKEN